MYQDFSKAFFALLYHFANVGKMVLMLPTSEHITCTPKSIQSRQFLKSNIDTDIHFLYILNGTYFGVFRARSLLKTMPLTGTIEDMILKDLLVRSFMLYISHFVGFNKMVAYVAKSTKKYQKVQLLSQKCIDR